MQPPFLKEVMWFSFNAGTVYRAVHVVEVMKLMLGQQKHIRQWGTPILKQKPNSWEHSIILGCKD